MNSDDYKRWADEVEDGFKHAARFLMTEKVFDAKFLPYATQLVPLAAIFVALGGRREDVAVRDRIARWYWYGVFGELYGSGQETQFAKDLPEVLSWLDGGDEPSAIINANFAPERLRSLRSRISAAYRGIYALLLREGAADLRTGESLEVQNYFVDAIDIHHLFPQKWCKDHGIPVEAYNSIVNKTPLSAKTNRVIGGSAPSTYLASINDRYVKDSEKLDGYLGRHLAPVEAMRSDSFETFMAERSRLLLGRIGTLMGKQLVSSPSDAEVEEMTDDEDLVTDYATQP